MGSKKNKLKFYVHDPKGSEWKEFDFYDKEKNILLLKQLILKKIENYEYYIQFDIGDVAIFEKYNMDPPNFKVHFDFENDSGRLLLDCNNVFERAQKIIKFYNHFGKDLILFLELLNLLDEYLDGYHGDSCQNFEQIIDEWLNNQ